MFGFMAGEGLVGIKILFEGRGRTIGKRRLGRREGVPTTLIYY